MNKSETRAELIDPALKAPGWGVIEAKKPDSPDTEGLGQPKKYAEKLETRFAYSTNGIGIYQVDMHTRTEGYINQYPTPDQLWEATFSQANQWRDRFFQK
jgi:type I restriction enzyme R subunit